MEFWENACKCQGVDLDYSVLGGKTNNIAIFYVFEINMVRLTN